MIRLGKIWYQMCRGLWALGLWLFFLFGLLCAAVLSFTLIYPGTWRSKYMRNFFKSASRLCAVMFGKSGRLMLSTEVFFDPRFQLMRRGLDTVERRHCEMSVYEEGAYCSLRDHEIKAK